MQGKKTNSTSNAWLHTKLLKIEDKLVAHQGPNDLEHSAKTT
jgi:hypothetical protein